MNSKFYQSTFNSVKSRLDEKTNARVDALTASELASAAWAAGNIGAAATGVGAPIAVASEIGNIGHDLVNAGWAALRGEWGRAGLNLLSAVPFLGTGVQAARAAKAGARALEGGKEVARLAPTRTLPRKPVELPTRPIETPNLPVPTRTPNLPVPTRTPNLPVPTRGPGTPNVPAPLPNNRRIPVPDEDDVPWARRIPGSDRSPTPRPTPKPRGIRLPRKTPPIIWTGSGGENDVGPGSMEKERRTRVLTDLIFSKLGAFDPNQPSPYGKSSQSRGNPMDAEEGRGRWSGFMVPTQKAMDFYRGGGSLVNDSYDPIKAKVQSSVRKYLNSKEGSELNKHLENLRKSIVTE